MDLSRYRGLFVEEAREHAAALARELAEPLPCPRPRLDALFRHAHSIKGMAASMGVEPVRDLAHALEELLARARDGSGAIDEPAREALLAAADALARMVEAYAREAAPEEPAPLLARLAALAARPGAGAPSPPPSRPAEEPSPAAGLLAPPPGAPAAVLARSTIRLEARFADALLERVTDLVLNLGGLVQALGPAPPAAARAPLEQLRRTLGELREDTLSVRLVPLGALEPELARAAREAAAVLGRRVRFALEGGDVALDRAVVEALGDPLAHLVRNAIDHGLEAPAERAAAGKPETGRVLLAVRREADSVYVSVRDDGRGMDPAALARGALERGQVDERELARMSTREVLLLATLPGLTTRREATPLSGRGVGLDLVRARVEGLGGRVEIASEPGVGTEVTLRAPLTLALQRLLLVAARGRRFALPLPRVHGVLDLRPERLVASGERTLARVEEEAVEVVDLAASLGLGAAPDPPPRAGVLFEARGRRWCLGVDEALAERELVVRPLGRPLQRLRPFAAGALLPEGRVALVLDVDGLVEGRARRGRAGPRAPA